MSHKLELNEEEFRKAWLEENLTKAQMCERFHISNGSVQTYVKKFGLKKTPEQKQEATRRTNLERYGVENVGQNPEIKQKIQKTFLDKYGETSALKNSEVRAKIEQTCMEKYGVTSIGLAEEVKKKREQTCMEKYGAKYSLGSQEVKDKAKETLLDKYGVDNAGKSKIVRDKMENTCYQRYGVKSTLKEPVTKQKIKETMMERYGVSHVSQIGYDDFTYQIMSSPEKMREYIENSSDKTVAGLVKNLKCKAPGFLQKVHKFGLFDLLDRFRSGEEAELFAWVSSLGVQCIAGARDVINGELDIYIPSHNLAIEFNGNYWHCELQKPKHYHESKSIACEEKGIRLIHVFEHEWTDERTRPIVESIIKGALGIFERKLFARKCVVKHITSDEAAQFLHDNHLQGARRAKLSYGLFFGDELVQMMSFSHNGQYKCWEIIRSCTKNNTLVVGGLSKLLSCFKNETQPNAIFSYCDYNKYSGKGYEALGMNFIGVTGPDLRWYMSDGLVLPRSPHRNEELSKTAVAKIWGAGSKKYLLIC